MTDGPISFGDLDEQFAEQAARTVKGSTSHEDGPRTSGNVQTQDTLPLTGVRRYLKATANGADWDSARRAVVKLDLVLGEANVYILPDQVEQIVRIVARVIARARTRGRKETLEAMDLDTDDCFDEVEG